MSHPGLTRARESNQLLFESSQSHEIPTGEVDHRCSSRGGPGVGFDLSTIVVGSLHHENTFKYQKSSRYSFLTMILDFFCHWEK